MFLQINQYHLSNRFETKLSELRVLNRVLRKPTSQQKSFGQKFGFFDIFSALCGVQINQISWPCAFSNSPPNGVEASVFIGYVQKCSLNLPPDSCHTALRDER